MIYFDNAATTKPYDIAVKSFIEISEMFANPSSVHSAGISAANILKNSREVIASTIGAVPNEIIFTPSGTFANNLALLGICKATQRKGKHIIITDSEHPSVFNTAKELEKNGYDVSLISTKNGKLNIEQINNSVNENTVLVSSMMVNNETGAKYDIKALYNAVKSKNSNTYIHCDAVQAYMKEPINIKELNVDLLSISSHKIHSFKGSGALYIKNGVRILPITFGGGQENNLCPGTESLPLIYSFAETANELNHSFGKRKDLIHNLYEYASERLSNSDCIINKPENHSDYILSLTVPSIKSEVMLNFLSSKGIYISAGSACSSHSKTNRVLAAYGLSSKQSDCTVRISFSEQNTKAEIDALVSAISEANKNLVKIN